MRRNIAFFLPHFAAGGVETVVLKVLQGLDRRRFQPHLILQQQRGELLCQLPADVILHRLSRPKPPGCIFELSRLCGQADVHLLVTVTNAVNLYALMAAALPFGRNKARPCTLVMEHTPPLAFLAEAKQPALRRLAMRLLYPRASLTGGPIDQIGTDLQTLLGAHAPKFTCLPNPVVDTIAPLRPLPDRAQHIVSVGRLAPEKRFDLLINSFALAHAQHPDLRLTIHGEGPERARLEALIASKNLTGTVTLPGYADDMDAVHSAADLFVCTSRREGLGNAIIEAMARGVPVISVDCPFGPPQLLQGGRAGRLLSDHSAAALAAAVTDLAQDRAARQRYREAGFDAVTGFDVTHAVAAYQAVFDQVLAAP